MNLIVAQNKTGDLFSFRLPGWLRTKRHRSTNPATKKLRTIPVFRVYVSRGWDAWDPATGAKQPSWIVHIQIGGAPGTRWIDFPGYSGSIHAPWYRHLSIGSREFAFGRNVKGTVQPEWRKPRFLAFGPGFGAVSTASCFVTKGFLRGANLSMLPARREPQHLSTLVALSPGGTTMPEPGEVERGDYALVSHPDHGEIWLPEERALEVGCDLLDFASDQWGVYVVPAWDVFLLESEARTRAAEIVG